MKNGKYSTTAKSHYFNSFTGDTTCLNGLTLFNISPLGFQNFKGVIHSVNSFQLLYIIIILIPMAVTEF